MTLETNLKKISDDERLYIGSKTGFFFIGTKTEIESLEKMEQKIKREYQSRIKIAKQEKQRLQKFYDAKISKEKLTNSEKQELQVIRNRIKKIDAKIDSLNDVVISKFKPILKRNVLSIYYKNTMPDELGVAIQLEGNESGRYWTYKEYINAN